MVRLLTDNGQCRQPGPSPPSVSLRRGLGDAGKAVSVDLLGERRQNGGDFFSRTNLWAFKLVVIGRRAICCRKIHAVLCWVPRCLVTIHVTWWARLAVVSRLPKLLTSWLAFLQPRHASRQTPIQKYSGTANVHTPSNTTCAPCELLGVRRSVRAATGTENLCGN